MTIRIDKNVSVSDDTSTEEIVDLIHSLRRDDANRELVTELAELIIMQYMADQDDFVEWHLLPFQFKIDWFAPFVWF
jgi:hypothetical protein